MLELILGVGFLLLFRHGYLHKKIENFRKNLKPGMVCKILILDTFFRAEIEAIQGTTVYYIKYDKIGNTDDHVQVEFNCRAHISQIYPIN